MEGSTEAKPQSVPRSMKVKQLLTRSIGPKALKVWMVILIAAVIIASVGAYEVLKPAEPPSTGQVSSVLGGSWASRANTSRS